MDEPVILITGGTGSVGGAAIRLLRDQGGEVRALVRRRTDSIDVPQIVGDLARPDEWRGSLADVSAVLLVFPTLQPDAELAAAHLLAILGGAGRRVVALSAWGAQEAAGEGGILGSHHRIETLLRRSSQNWTILRPSGFATNTLGWADQLRDGDELHWFYPEARRSLIHEKDIAAVAVRALVDDAHGGQTYHLTGPAALTQIEQLEAIGSATKRPLRFDDIGTAGAHHLFPDAPPGLVEAILAGQAEFVSIPEPVTDTVAMITDRPAYTFAEWARDHASAFGRAGA